MRAAHATVSSRSWELHTTMHHCPIHHESCKPLSCRSWELHTSVLSSLDHESWTPVSSRSWELNTSVLSIMRPEHQCSVFLIVRAAYQCPLDHESCTLPCYSVLSIMRAANHCPLDHETCTRACVPSIMRSTPHQQCPLTLYVYYVDYFWILWILECFGLFLTFCSRFNPATMRWSWPGTVQQQKLKIMKLAPELSSRWLNFRLWGGNWCQDGLHIFLFWHI
jgi:hypothetical protein